MTKVNLLNAKIIKILDKIRILQKKCNHKRIKRTYNNSWGTYDEQEWHDLSCKDCSKHLGRE